MYANSRAINPLTPNDIQRKVNSFSIGDKIQAVTDREKEELLTIVRFYPRFIMCKREDGSTYSLHNFDAMQARLVKPSGFRVHDEQMDRDAIVTALGDKRIGDS